MSLEEEEPEQPVDDARHRGHEVDDADEEPARLQRRVVREVERHGDGDRRRDRHRGQADQDGAEQHRDDAEMAMPCIRDPLRGGEERQPRDTQRLLRPVGKEGTDEQLDQKYGDAAPADQRAEDPIGPGGGRDESTRLHCGHGPAHLLDLTPEPPGPSARCRVMLVARDVFLRAGR